MHGYIKSPQIQIFTGDPQKGPQTKQVLQLQVLCITMYMYRREIRTKLFPNQDIVLQSYFLALLNKWNFVKEAIIGGLHVYAGLSEWQNHPQRRVL